MKVRIVMTIDVDPDEWVAVYGGRRDGVREDVKDYAFHNVVESAGIKESGATVTLVK
jgi:hypothetical protein